jgi:hypothetical protein
MSPVSKDFWPGSPAKKLGPWVMAIATPNAKDEMLAAIASG